MNVRRIYRGKILSLIACLAVAAAAVAVPAAAYEKVDNGTYFTYKVDSYQDFMDALGALNGGDEAGVPVVVELQNNLDVDELTTKGDAADAVTGATLAIARGEITVDGGSYTIYSRGYPLFNVEGARSEADALSDITIKDLTADGAAYQAKPGGGNFFENRAYITLENCTFKNCSAAKTGGGAIYAGPHGGRLAPNLTVKGCTFTDNSAAEGAGGAILGRLAELVIENCTFSGNTAKTGGAIALYGSGASLTVDGASTFDGNSATASGGAVSIQYGSNGTDSTTGLSTTVGNATFTNNSAAVSGTDDVCFGVYYAPSFSGTVTDSGSEFAASLPVVGGSKTAETRFADADRSVLFTGTLHNVATYRELKDALGYCKFDTTEGDWEMDADGHAVITAGSAASGDIVVISANLTAETESGNTSAAPRSDAVTGATVYVARPLSIYGNGHSINGDGYPVFDIDGGDAPVTASITSVDLYGGGYNAKLGGAVFVEGDATLNVYSSNFTDCEAGYTGEVFAGGGGAIYLDPHGSGSPVLGATDCNFTGNKALMGTGGAISSINGSISLTNCVFTGNKAAQGGALGMKGTGTLAISTAVMTDNEAACAGGAIDIHHGTSWYKKSESMNKSSDITTTIRSLTVSGNSAAFAPDIAYSRYYDESFPGDGSAVQITYTPSTAEAVHTDLTFSDIHRTTLQSSVSGSSGGCDAGATSALVLAILAGAALLRKRP